MVDMPSVLMQSFDFPSAEGKHLPLPAQVPCQQHHQSCIFVKSPWWKDRWYQSLKDKGVKCMIKLIPQTHSATYFSGTGGGQASLIVIIITVASVCVRGGGREGGDQGGREGVTGDRCRYSNFLALPPPAARSHEKPLHWKVLPCGLKSTRLHWTKLHSNENH